MTVNSARNGWLGEEIINFSIYHETTRCAYPLNMPKANNQCPSQTLTSRHCLNVLFECFLKINLTCDIIQSLKNHNVAFIYMKIMYTSSMTPRRGHKHAVSAISVGPWPTTWYTGRQLCQVVGPAGLQLDRG